jgi:prepilin-type N-terminal cleavage/methylation domain-containing protein
MRSARPGKWGTSRDAPRSPDSLKSKAHMADGLTYALRPATPSCVAHALLSRWGHYSMSRSRTSGFTLVEMAITILVMGLLIGFSVPAFLGVSQTYQLKGATENIAAQLRLAREKAMSTGVNQPFHFHPNFLNSDYMIHDSANPVYKWKLPQGITYFSVTIHPTMMNDGRASGSGDIILRDRRGNKDTVSVLTSGLILTMKGTP